MAELDRKPAAGAKKSLSWTITPVDPKGGLVGATLRAAREERGLSVDDVAAVLKIRREHIASIESSRVDDLPGLPYAIGFIRTYAEYLGMDGLDAVRRFKGEISEPADEGALTFPTPIDDQKFPIALLLAGAGILAAALYGAWYFYARDDAATVDAPAAPVTEAASEPEAAASRPVAPAAPEAAAPAAPAPAIPAPVEQSAAESEAVPKRPAETEASPAEPATDSGTPEATTGSAATEAEEARPSSPGVAETEAPTAESETPARPSATPPPSPVEEAEAAPASPAIAAAEGPAVPPETAPAQERESETESTTGSTTQESAVSNTAPSTGQGTPGPSRVELRATSDSWVVIRDAQSKILFARILAVGESYAVPSLPNLSMVTGNAGALDIYVDGRMIKPLGPMGAVRRDVALDPDELLARQ